MESTTKIRHWILREGKSIHSVSRKTGLSRNTIKKYLKDGSKPTYRRKQTRARPKLAAFEERLRTLFDQDVKRPRKERPCAKSPLPQPNACFFSKTRQFSRIRLLTPLGLRRTKSLNLKSPRLQLRTRYS